MQDNPYASPVIPADLVEQQAVTIHELKIASQGKRFLNFILDSVFLQVLSGVAGFAFGVVFAVLRISAGGTVTQQDQQVLQVLGYLIGILVSLSYFIFTEAVFQRTLAKLITGTLVVNAEGGKPTLMQIVGRSFARYIPFEPFSFFVGDPPVGWHDRLSSTRVIDLR
jgi:uncharacterized RDD family membrane protein YckC